jgi:hypothetical protein
MVSDILPFRPVLRDLIRNLWYLRFFLFLIFLFLLISSIILVIFEGSHLAPQGTFVSRWGIALWITFNGILFNFRQDYTPSTIIGEAMEILNSLISYILLGIMIWVIEQSLTGHKLEKSRYFLFPNK